MDSLWGKYFIFKPLFAKSIHNIFLNVLWSSVSRREYDQIISEWLARRGAEISPGSNRVPLDFTVSELLARYLVHADSYYVKRNAPTKEVSNLKYAMKPLAQLYGRNLVREFGPLKLKAVRKAMVASDLARTVANERINRIKRIFRWGVENELVDPSVLHGLEAVIRTTPLRSPICVGLGL